MRKGHHIWVYVFCLILGWPDLLRAESENRIIVQGMSWGERGQRSHLSSMRPASLQSLAAAVEREALEREAKRISSLGNLSIGARSTDADGRAPIHDYLLDRLAGLEEFGVTVLGSLKTEVAVPVLVENQREATSESARTELTTDEGNFKLYPLWPNGAMPSLAPAEGLSGPLVDAGLGRWEDVDGKDFEGAIALMRFGGGRYFERLFSLGAQAVIVIEDDFINRQIGERLFYNTPTPFPRYFVDRSTGERLRELARKGEEARVTGGHVYENRPVESIFVSLPAHAPIQVEITESSLLDLLGMDYGLGADQLREYNPQLTGVPKPGDRIRFPGIADGHVVVEGELMARLAALYSVNVEALRRVNELPTGDPLPGTKLEIPNLEEDLLLFVPVDSVSVVPDYPHGAKVAANLATALLMLEHLARAEDSHRRRDLHVVFTDGDTVGGVASRKFAESVLLVQGLFESVGTDSRDAALARYEAALAWFRDGSATLPEDVARWLMEEWVFSRIEDVRIQLAESRIPLVIEFRQLEGGPEADAVARKKAAIEEEIQKLTALRDPIDGRFRTMDNRLRELYEVFTEGETAELAERYGIGFQTLKQRFEAELSEERTQLSNQGNNETLARSFLDQVNPRWGENETRYSLGWYLDIGDAQASLAFASTGDGQQMTVSPRTSSLYTQLAPRLRKTLAFAADKAGWEEDFTFVTLTDRAKFPQFETEAPADMADFWLSAGVGIISLTTANDLFTRLDTPHDTLDRINWEHFAIQARTALAVMKIGLESASDSAALQDLKKLDYARVEGQALAFNIRSGIDAKEPVPGAYAFIVNRPNDTNWEAVNSNAWRGYRRSTVVKTLLNGSYQMPLATFRPPGREQVHVYRLDPERALIDKVLNEGQVGTQTQTPKFTYRRNASFVKNLVMTEVYPLALIPGSDPFAYTPIGGSGLAPKTIRVEDAVRNGEPRDYALDNPHVDFRERNVDALVAYLKPETQARFLVQSGTRYFMLLTGELREEDGKARGAGVPVGPGDDGERRLVRAFTPIEVADNMLAFARYRLDVYKRFGITSRSLESALEKARLNLEEALEAQEAMEYHKAIGEARAAWGILIKNYPRILSLGRQAVFSVILLMAILLPCAYFLERLLIGSRGILGKLAGTTLVFSLGTLFLGSFHPAFKISLSPFIIVIAFTMILMSVIVLSICYQRFEVLLRRVRSSSGEVESEEIGLIESVATALSLGVSNLRKRPFRTFLTTLTVTALTFSIVAFVSVKGQDALDWKFLELDTFLDGEEVVPEEPAYEGLLFRNFQWQKLEEDSVAAYRTEFGRAHDLAVRAWYLEVEGGNQADREGANQIRIRRGEDLSVFTGIMCFEPSEARVTGLNRAVSGGGWFLPDREVNGERRPADRRVVIIPDRLASDLGIDPGMLLDENGDRLAMEALPEVEFSNYRWKVIGILDTDVANRIRDVNGKSLAMVDYLRSGFSPAVGGQLENEGESYHANWADFVIIPLEAYRDVKAEIRSVAVRLSEGTDPARFYDELSLRRKEPFFAQSEGLMGLLRTREQLDLAGVAKVFLPVLLCILIVMNTMLGAVDERRGEVNMLGAIGLSPRQISFLMLSEATVYSIVGMIFGVFSGLLFSNAAVWLNGHGIAFFPGLSFNFTSMLSMVLATGTGLIVLLATLLPAKQAAAMAAPSGMTSWELPEPDEDHHITFTLPFTLTQGNAIGMLIFFRQFLQNHTETTSADFNCRHIEVEAVSGEDGKGALSVRCLMWLSPYDLDVAQRFALHIESTDSPGVFHAHIKLARTSGSEENWQRTNYGFLNLVRQQFLLWRNLKPEARLDYIRKGQAHLAETR